MQPLKVAHISDFHLRHHLPGPVRGKTRLGRLVPELLPPVTSEIRSTGVDLLAVTGDLLCYQYRQDIGPETEGQAIRDLELLQAMLKEVGCPVVVIPGNHDNEDLVQQVFGAFPEEQRLNGTRIICFRDIYGPSDFPGRREAELQRLRLVLTDKDSSPQLHLRHAILWPREADEDHPDHEMARRLAKLIGESGRVRMVLSGHRHAGFPPAWVGGTCFSTVPAFSDPPHPYRIYTITNEGIEIEDLSAT